MLLRHRETQLFFCSKFRTRAATCSALSAIATTSTNSVFGAPHAQLINFGRGLRVVSCGDLLHGPLDAERSIPPASMYPVSATSPITAAKLLALFMDLFSERPARRPLPYRLVVLGHFAL